MARPKVNALKVASSSPARSTGMLIVTSHGLELL